MVNQNEDYADTSKPPTKKSVGGLNTDSNPVRSEKPTTEANLAADN
jgi:hypothetical protein